MDLKFVTPDMYVKGQGLFIPVMQHSNYEALMARIGPTLSHINIHLSIIRE